MDKIFYILALACFLLDAFGLETRVKLLPLGAAFIAASLVF